MKLSYLISVVILLSAVLSITAFGQEIIFDQIGDESNYTGNGQRSGFNSMFFINLRDMDIAALDDFSINKRYELMSVDIVYLEHPVLFQGYNLIEDWSVQIYSSPEAAAENLIGDVASISGLNETILVAPYGTRADSLVSLDLSNHSLILDPGDYWISVMITNIFFVNGTLYIMDSGIDDGPGEEMNAYQANPDEGQEQGVLHQLQETLSYRITAKPATGTIATLTNFGIDTGILLDGGLPDLESSDDLYVHTRSGFGETLVDLHNMEMIVNAETTVDAPSSLNLKIESRIDEPAGLAQIEFRNWNTNQFESVGSYSLGNVDQIDTINNIDAANYVDGAGNIDLSIKHLVFVPFLAFTFESFIDQVEIVVD